MKGLGCTGHIDLSRIQNFSKTDAQAKVCAFLSAQKKAAGCNKENLVLYCGFAHGADLLFAEAAIACCVDVVAVLPCEREEFATEHPDGGAAFWRALEKAKDVVIVPCKEYRYLGVAEYIVEKCDVMLGLCDREKWREVEQTGEEVARGGTFDVLRMAKKAGKEIVLF